MVRYYSNREERLLCLCFSRWSSILNNEIHYKVLFNSCIRQTFRITSQILGWSANFNWVTTWLPSIEHFYSSFVKFFFNKSKCLKWCFIIFYYKMVFLIIFNEYFKSFRQLIFTEIRATCTCVRERLNYDGRRIKCKYCNHFKF